MWNDKPFLYWLYAKLCHNNQTHVYDTKEQLKLLKDAAKIVPPARTRFQRFVRTLVMRHLNKRIQELENLFDIGMVEFGWITFNEPKTLTFDGGVVDDVTDEVLQ